MVTLVEKSDRNLTNIRKLNMVLGAKHKRKGIKQEPVALCLIGGTAVEIPGNADNDLVGPVQLSKEMPEDRLKIFKFDNVQTTCKKELFCTMLQPNGKAFSLHKNEQGQADASKIVYCQILTVEHEL